MKTRKIYTPEFKAQALELIATGKPVSELARDLRRHYARLQIENDILKKAAVILGTRVPASCGK